MRLTESLANFSVDPAQPPSLCIRLNAQPGALEQLMAMETIEIAGASPGLIADAGFGGGRLMWWDDVSQEDPVQIAEFLSKHTGSGGWFGRERHRRSLSQPKRKR